MKSLIVKKEHLELFEEHVVCLNTEVFNEVNTLCKEIDKLNGGDYFDGLLVDMGMLTMMKDVWYGRRESFTINLTQTIVGSVSLS